MKTNGWLLECWRPLFTSLLQKNEKNKCYCCNARSVDTYLFVIDHQALHTSYGRHASRRLPLALFRGSRRRHHPPNSIPALRSRRRRGFQTFEGLADLRERFPRRLSCLVYSLFRGGVTSYYRMRGGAGACYRRRWDE